MDSLEVNHLKLIVSLYCSQVLSMLRTYGIWSGVGSLLFSFSSRDLMYRMEVYRLEGII